MKKSKIDDVCFEEALGKLELIVKELETGELPLDESLKKFEEGIGLSRLCLGKLNDAEEFVDRILKEENGVISEKPVFLSEE